MSAMIQSDFQERPLPLHLSPHAPLDQPPDRPRKEVSIGGLLGLLWRYRVLFGIWLAATLGIAGMIIERLSPLYRTEGTVALDTRQIQFSESNAVVSGTGNMLDSSYVRSEVAILSSDDLARRVVQDLKLSARPEFAPVMPLTVELTEATADIIEACCAPLQSIVTWLRDTSSSLKPKPLTPEEQFAATLGSYRKSLQVTNDGRSYILTVSFSSSSQELAQKIVNRQIELYIESQRRVKDRALDTATAWLDREVTSLAERVTKAENVLQDYRDQHHLLSSNVQPVSQQQLATATGQLALAEADFFQRNARLQAARAPDGVNGMTEVIVSDGLARLRENEVAAQNRLFDALGRFGEHHPAIEPLRLQLAQIQGMLQSERQKIVQGISTEVEIARQRRNDLQRTVTLLQAQLSDAQRAQLGAQQLEREASAVRALYESLLSRQKLVATQVGIQRADAYMVSQAELPRQPYFPNKHLLYAVAFMLSASAGTGVTFMLDRRKRAFADLTGVRTNDGLRKLASIPRVAQKWRQTGLALADLIADAPRSAATESVRALRNGTFFQANAPKRVLAITSCVPGEGKTSIALALARSIGGHNRRVLLIEADLHRRTLGKLAQIGADEIGLVAVLNGNSDLREAVLPDRVSGVDILYAETTVDVPQDLLLPACFQQVITAAKRHYDYVIVDTPPVGLVSDALLIARSVEATLLVIKAESTLPEHVMYVTREFMNAGLPIVGTVLNLTDPRATMLSRRSRGQRLSTIAYLEV